MADPRAHDAPDADDLGAVNPTLDPACLGDQSFEDALEPVHLIRRSHAVMRAGLLMLGAGTSSLRVRALMQRIAEVVGLEEMQAQIGFTTISLTVARRGIFRTQVGEVGWPGVNAHRIALLHRLTHELPDNQTATQIDQRLDAIEHLRPVHPSWLVVALVALACASVTLLTGGGWREVLAVLPASALSFLGHRALQRRQVNHLATVLTSAFTATGLFVVFTAALDALLGDHSARMTAGFICAAIYLIPGFALVTGGLDLCRIDLEAGLPRVTYAAMVLLSITIGVWIVAALRHVSPTPAPDIQGPPWLVWMALAVASFLAVTGWSTMFNNPWQCAVASGAIAVVANIPRLVLLHHGVSNHVATFVGCFIIGVACHVVGRRFRLTKIVMTVPAVLVSIPGSSALRTLIYFDQADVVRAMQNGIQTVLVVIAMVAGLAGSRMLTDPEWAFTRPDPPQLRLRSLTRVVRHR